MMAQGILSGGLHGMCRATAAAIVQGRCASTGVNNTGSNYTLGFSGGAAANGSWIIALISDNQTSSNNTISDGTGLSWTPAAGNVTGSRLYYRQCGASEPANYTISYAGSGKLNVSCAMIFEILNANATNPDAAQNATSTATPPAATTTGTSDISILVASINGTGSSTSTFTAPSGWTIPTNGSITQNALAQCVMAYKLVSGAQTVTPGSWGSADKQWQIALKA
jgi:hypothetical protein